MEDDIILNGHFFSPTCGNLSLDGAIKEIFRYIAEDREKFYDIVVGCDSSSEEEPTFPLAIVVLRKGAGGRFFLKRIKYPEGRKFYGRKQRILNEVLLSCQLALTLREKIANPPKSLTLDPAHYEFRYIHADVGENGATKDMIKEVIGLIRGSGFEPMIKPQSFAASVVADRYA